MKTIILCIACHFLDLTRLDIKLQAHIICISKSFLATKFVEEEIRERTKQCTWVDLRTLFMGKNKKKISP